MNNLLLQANSSYFVFLSHILRPHNSANCSKQTKELGFQCEKLSDSFQMQMYLQPFQIGKGVKYSWLQCNQSITIQVTETGRELNKSNYQSRIQYDMPFKRYIKIPQSSALCGLDKQRVYRLLLSSIGKIKNKRAQESSPSPSTATMCFF